MSDEATLRDVTVSPNPTDAAKPLESEKPSATEVKIEVNDPGLAEATEIGRILIESGYNKGQVNSLLEAPKALTSLRALLDSDPKQFVKQYALNNPDGASKLRDAVAEEYVELYGNKKGDDAGKNGKPDSELMQVVSSLREEVAGYRTEREQANSRAALAATQSRYNSRVDEFFSQDGVKGLGLTKSEQRGIRATLDQELASDPDAVRRVSNGNFVDVAPKFKHIIEDWAADKRTAAQAEKEAREGVASGANFTLPGGPQQISVEDKVFDSWDSTEDAFAKALTKAR